jgi:hypothetical protein
VVPQEHAVPASRLGTNCELHEHERVGELVEGSEEETPAGEAIAIGHRSSAYESRTRHHAKA